MSDQLLKFAFTGSRVRGELVRRDAAWRDMEVAISTGRAAHKMAEIIAAEGEHGGPLEEPGVLPEGGAG